MNIGDKLFHLRREILAQKTPFSSWMASVNKIISSKIGLISDDLPDQNYFDMWERGVKATTAANKAIKSA